MGVATGPLITLFTTPPTALPNPGNKLDAIEGMLPTGSASMPDTAGTGMDDRRGATTDGREEIAGNPGTMPSRVDRI